MTSEIEDLRRRMSEITATSVPALTIGAAEAGVSGSTSATSSSPRARQAPADESEGADTPVRRRRGGPGVGGPGVGGPGVGGPGVGGPGVGGRATPGAAGRGAFGSGGGSVAEGGTPGRRRPGGRADGARARIGRHEPEHHDDPSQEELSPDELAAKERREASRAHDIALRRLTVRGRSRRELATDLARRDVAPEVAEAVIDRLEGVGLVDDGSFATSWVESRRGSQRVSSGQIRRQLRQKGVADEHIDAALAENGPDDLATARDLAQARMRSLRGLDRAAQERRLAGYLARRGYGGSLVSQVVREVLAAG